MRLKAMLLPASIDEIMAELGKILLHCPMRNLSEAQASLLLQDYVEEMQSYPIDAIRKGARAYRMNSENVFFPNLPLLLQHIYVYTQPINQQILVIEKILNTPPEPVREESKINFSEENKQEAKPRYSHQEMIKNTLQAMREDGAPESDIQEFLQMMENGSPI